MFLTLNKMSDIEKEQRARARKEKQRVAFIIWKMKNLDHYKAQKKRLASRPEYLAHRREQYRQKRLLYVDKKRGRKALDLSPEDKKARRLQQMREACKRYRVRLREEKSLAPNKDVTTPEHKGLNFSCDRPEYTTSNP